MCSFTAPDRQSSVGRASIADACVVVDRAPVVGIHQAEVPQFSALVDVGRAGRTELPRELREAVDRAVPRDVVDEVAERVVQDPPAVRDRPARDVDHRGFVRFVRVEPSGRLLGFAQCLHDVRRDAFLERVEVAPVERPRAEQRLRDETQLDGLYALPARPPRPSNGRARSRTRRRAR